MRSPWLECELTAQLENPRLSAARNLAESAASDGADGGAETPVIEGVETLYPQCKFIFS